VETILIITFVFIPMWLTMIRPAIQDHKQVKKETVLWLVELKSLENTLNNN